MSDYMLAKHTEGKWCHDLHCSKCYGADRWQASEVERLRQELLLSFQEKDVAIAAERERCALVCFEVAQANELRGNVFKTSPDEHQTHIGEMHLQGAVIAIDCAKAIRALK